MKTVFYNSRIAEFFTPMSGFKTITLFGFVFTEKSELSNTVLAHERIHQQQYAEMVAAGLCIASLCTVIFDTLWVWILPFTLYYILYIVEYLIHLIRLRDSVKAYSTISFEREAYDLMNEITKDCSIRRKRRTFGWVHYLISQNYRAP